MHSINQYKMFFYNAKLSNPTIIDDVNNWIRVHALNKPRIIATPVTGDSICIIVGYRVSIRPKKHHHKHHHKKR